MNVESGLEHGPTLENPVTFVPLFRYGGLRLEASRKEYQALADYKSYEREVLSNYAARVLKGREVESSLNRLAQRIIDTSLQVNSLVSSISAGRTYLIFLQELKPQGYTDAQIYQLFGICLRIHNATTITYTGDTQYALIRQQSKDFNARGAKPIAARAVYSRPTWFHGNIHTFDNFVTEYSDFWSLLNPEKISLPHEDKMQLEINKSKAIDAGEDYDDIFGVTTAENLPDWLTDDNNPPALEAVKDELKSDETDNVLMKKERQLLIKQANYLHQVVKDKFTKAEERLNQRWAEVKVADPCLGDFLSFMHIILEGEGDFAEKIKFYTDLERRITDSEDLSLWIEDNFKKIGVVDQGLITNFGEEILKAYFPTLNSDNPENKVAFSSFRETNRKGFMILNYDLRPFMEMLNHEDLELINQFLDDQNSKEAGPIISFIGDLLSENIKKQQNALPENLVKAFKNYREFLRKFLRNNWQTLYQQFYSILFPSKEVEEEKPAPEEEYNYKRIVEQVDEEIFAIDKGNLLNWTLLYSPEERIEEESAIIVSGDTLDQKSRFLQDLIAHLGVSNSIKPDSIIHALDWKTQSPKEVEQLVPIIIVRGEKWKKFKRQAMRIIYRMFPDEKKLMFFLYKKKGLSYDLPAV